MIRKINWVYRFAIEKAPVIVGYRFGYALVSRIYSYICANKFASNMSALEISENDFLTGARKGIQKSRLLSIARESGLTMKELSSYLRISTRSIQEKEPTQLIAPGPSERALYIAKLFKLGIETFSSKEKFHNWLNSENFAMGGEKPVSYLDTFSGIQLVMDELNAIEYGFSA